MRKRWIRISAFLLGAACLLSLLVVRAHMAPSPRESQILAGARSCLGDIYDADYVEGGPPPRGRGACTDVVYWAYLPLLDLQREVDKDRREQGLSGKIDANIDYRWCPTLIEWFRRHCLSLPHDVNISTVMTFRPGDVIFYDDGHSDTPGHVGVVSDRWSFDGKPLLIHNPGPRAVEENALTSRPIVGHFRLP